jgi:hypothetical protein
MDRSMRTSVNRLAVTFCQRIPAKGHAATKARFAPAFVSKLRIQTACNIDLDIFTCTSLFAAVCILFNTLSIHKARQRE